MRSAVALSFQVASMSVQPPAALILYVEDEVLIQDVLQTALEEAGFKVVVVSSGAEALDRLQTLAGELKGLITDVNLGSGIKGWEIGRHARGLAPGLPVIYVSGGSEHEWTAEGVPQSIMIAKPFAPTQVIVAVSTLINAAGYDQPG